MHHPITPSKQPPADKSKHFWATHKEAEKRFEQEDANAQADGYESSTIERLRRSPALRDPKHPNHKQAARDLAAEYARLFPGVEEQD